MRRRREPEGAKDMPKRIADRQAKITAAARADLEARRARAEEQRAAAGESRPTDRRR